jgi:hypothetical protein
MNKILMLIQQLGGIQKAPKNIISINFYIMRLKVNLMNFKM